MAYPSTFVDLQNAVIAKIGLDSTNDLSKVKDWLNRAYYETVIETEALYNCIDMTLVAGSAKYTLPTEILRIKGMFCTPVGNTRSRPLEPVSLEQLFEWKATDPTSSTGGVTHYALLGVTQIEFFPTPQAADEVTCYYIRQPTALSADADVPVIQEPYVTECIQNGALYQAALFLNDPNALIYKRDYEESIRKFRGHLRRKQGAMTMQFRVTHGFPKVPHDPSTDIR